MREHLKKMNNTLFPLYKASSSDDFAKNVTNQAFKISLEFLAADIVDPLLVLHSLVSFFVLFYFRTIYLCLLTVKAIDFKRN